MGSGLVYHYMNDASLFFFIIRNSDSRARYKSFQELKVGTNYSFILQSSKGAFSNLKASMKILVGTAKGICDEVIYSSTRVRKFEKDNCPTQEFCNSTIDQSVRLQSGTLATL